MPGAAGPDCGALDGAYRNAPEGAGPHLTEVLGMPAAARARTVVLTMKDDGSELGVTAAGGASARLRRDADYSCHRGGVRLVRSLQGARLTHVLVHDVEVFHDLTRSLDGGLTDQVSTKEHATVADVPLTGPERPGAVTHWLPAAGGR